MWLNSPSGAYNKHETYKNYNNNDFFTYILRLREAHAEHVRPAEVRAAGGESLICKRNGVPTARAGHDCPFLRRVCGYLQRAHWRAEGYRLREYRTVASYRGAGSRANGQLRKDAFSHHDAGIKARAATLQHLLLTLSQPSRRWPRHGGDARFSAAAVLSYRCATSRPAQPFLCRHYARLRDHVFICRSG